MVYFQQSLFGKMSWERFHQMTGWILEPSYPLSQTPIFQCLLLEDGQEPEWCEGRTPDLCWRLMDAQHWASPRLARRQRVFVVADFGGQCSHEILFKPRTVQSISASGGDCWLSAACGDRGSFIEAGRRVPITRPFQCYRMRASAKERTTEAFRNSFGLPTDPFPTLLASAVSPFAFWYEDDPAGGCVRFPTERECERLMGLPEGWTKCGADGEEILSAHRYRALGNAIALPCAEYIMRGIYDVLTRRC